MSGYLVVRPRSGLCNRLRVLFSADLAAKRLGRTLLVDWEDGDFECGAGVDDLFVHDFRTPGWTVTRALRRLPATPDVTEKWLSRVESQEVVDRAARPDVWFDWVQGLSEVRILPELTARIVAVDQALGEQPRIGVQVRTHADAHPRSKKQSPLGWYVDRIGQLLETHPDAVVFASCDTAQSGEVLAEAFGDTLHILGGKSAYGSKGGVQDAFCDLQLLATCQYLLTATGSSLGTTARIMQSAVACESAADHVGLTADAALVHGATARQRQALLEGYWKPAATHMDSLRAAMDTTEWTRQARTEQSAPAPPDPRQRRDPQGR